MFLELTLIRWIPANIRLIGYFSNLVLLASFFGMGIGLLWHSSRRRLFPWMPAALLLLLLVVASFRVDINVASPNAVFFKGLGDHDLPVVDPVAILPMLFFLISAVFVIVGQEFGRLFSHLPALVAYTWDIAGSLSGIVLFTLSAWLSTPAWIWFIIIVLVYLWLLNKRKHTALVPALLAGFAVILLTYLASRNSIWSPYYKINVQHMLTGYNVDVNNISNQYVTHWENKEGFYRLPYQSFRDNTFKKILVIGSGTGSDVAVALALDPTVEHIDAVEIDPSVADLGRKLNPDRPYDDPRVRLIITDGRNYLGLGRAFVRDGASLILRTYGASGYTTAVTDPTSGSFDPRYTA
ncbi:MAG: hypothetical protein NT149_05010, partial [Candidatus Gottesmanbacteria bacterium]|nr:hypothetical protein [Candidatus Gottesmanbacteria bacterium]